jgi:hypothetical protein
MSIFHTVSQNATIWRDAIFACYGKQGEVSNITRTLRLNLSVTGVKCLILRKHGWKRALRWCLLTCDVSKLTQVQKYNYGEYEGKSDWSIELQTSVDAFQLIGISIRNVILERWGIFLHLSTVPYNNNKQLTVGNDYTKICMSPDVLSD